MFTPQGANSYHKEQPFLKGYLIQSSKQEFMRFKIHVLLPEKRRGVNRAGAFIRMITVFCFASHYGYFSGNFILFVQDG